MCWFQAVALEHFFHRVAEADFGFRPSFGPRGFGFRNSGLRHQTKANEWIVRAVVCRRLNAAGFSLRMNPANEASDGFFAMAEPQMSGKQRVEIVLKLGAEECRGQLLTGFRFY